MARKKKNQMINSIIITTISILSTLFSISFYFWIRENVFLGDIQLMLIVSGILLLIAVIFGIARWSQIQKKL